MPYLLVIKGPNMGERLNLTASDIVMGRNADNGIVLDHHSVSRRHAKLNVEGNNVSITDLDSRNGTFVNSQAIDQSHSLNDGDEIRICDYVLRYSSEVIPKQTESETISNSASQLREKQLVSRSSDSVDLESSSILSSIESQSQVERAAINPEAKLRAILGVSAALVKTLDLDELLPKILNSLFVIFPYADAGFILLKDPETGTTSVRASKQRNEQDRQVPLSETIIDRAMSTGEAVLSADVTDDTRFRSSLSVAALEIRSIMCVPLKGPSGDLVGVIQLSTNDCARIFRQDDLEILLSVGSQCALAIENAEVHAEVLRQQDVARQIEFATQIQQSFLPQQAPDIEGYEFAHYYQAAFQIGGDYFDYIPLPEGKIAVAQGDVSGKGVPAALLMARLSSSLRYRLLMEQDYAKVLEAINREVYNDGIDFRFITLALMIIDPRESTIGLVNAGHLPPALKRGSEVTYLEPETSGWPLGIEPDSTYELTTYPVEPNDIFMLYTDGLTESIDDEFELFGRGRLAETLSGLKPEVSQISDGMMQAINDFSDDQQPKDDRCLVVFGRQCSGENF